MYSGSFTANVGKASKVWLPSAQELFNTTGYEWSGRYWKELFKTNADRQRSVYGESTGRSYVLSTSRTNGASYLFNVKTDGGGPQKDNGSMAIYICFGFCM